MTFLPSYRRARPLCLSATALVMLSACSQGFDYDLRGLGDGFSTSAAAQQAATAARPEPDNRGVISYPTYQVAVANKGDTIDAMATRLGIDAPTLASFNGIEQNAPLRRGEIVALPTRVAEPSPATGAVATGPIMPGSVDIGQLAGGAIERSEGTQQSGVRVASLPPATAAPAPAAQTGTEPVRHKVQRGETAYTISRLYDVPVKTLAEWNGLGPDFSIREGQFLLIPVSGTVAAAPVSGNVPKPGTGSPTPTPPSAATPLPKPSVETAALDTPPPPVTIVPPTTPVATDARMLFPVKGSIIRDYAKGRNDGIDIKAAAGDPVVAADAGTVAAITKSAEGIPIIVIRHEPELLTVYANVADVSIDKGARVARGQQIATLREGDKSYLHFEVRKGFDSVDPTPYLQ